MIVTNILAIDGHTYTACDEILAKRAADLLNKHYPGHLWAVNVNADEKGGVMIIKNFSISYRYGYTLHLTKLDAKLRKVLMAGGEILERARMARASWNGQGPRFIDGVPDKHQPIPSMGIII
jgi:hypothetical protein